MVIFPITLIQLEYLSVMAAYVYYTSGLYIWVCRLSMHMRYPAESKEIDNIVGVLYTVVSWLAAP